MENVTGTVVSKVHEEEYYTHCCLKEINMEKNITTAVKGLYMQKDV